MTDMKILIAPHKFLRHKAKKVTKIDKKLVKNLEDMTDTLRAATDPEGVGLAATQVGLDYRLFILNIKNKIQVIINPEIVSQSEATLSQVYPKAKDRWLEGCLSLPKLWGFVDRPFWTELKYQTIVNGELVTKQTKFQDVESSYALHELDHLDGILFTDRILEQGGTLLRETPNGLVKFEE